LIADFPISEIVNTMRVQFIQQAGNKPEIGTPEIKEAGGLRLSRLQESGAPDTMISIDKENISLICHNYSRWDKIWPKQSLYIDKIFAKLHSSQSYLTGIGMKWTDQFIYEGSDTNYDAKLLLNERSECLHSRAFKSGPRWHCHSGWFDKGISDSPEVLNQLNIDAGLVNIEGSMRIAITIDHAQLVRATHSVDALATFSPQSQAGAHALSGLMQTLHDGNKRILRDLLNDSSLKAIGMGAE
jgi:uncharacterized protein (TIGR04255 family)